MLSSFNLLSASLTHAAVDAAQGDSSDDQIDVTRTKGKQRRRRDRKKAKVRMMEGSPVCTRMLIDINFYQELRAFPSCARSCPAQVV